jgi:hypothetical protein
MPSTQLVKQSESRLTSSALTTLTERAAVANNES